MKKRPAPSPIAIQQKRQEIAEARAHLRAALLNGAATGPIRDRIHALEGELLALVDAHARDAEGANASAERAIEEMRNAIVGESAARLRAITAGLVLHPIPTRAR